MSTFYACTPILNVCLIINFNLNNLKQVNLSLSLSSLSTIAWLIWFKLVSQVQTSVFGIVGLALSTIISWRFILGLLTSGGHDHVAAGYD